MTRYGKWEKNNYAPLATLKQHGLFMDCLLPDIKKGDVFPAVRKSKIDFYHVGRKLFSFDGKNFRSNIAYLVAYQNDPSGEVSEPAFKDLKLCESFQEGYSQIKKNTKLYAEPESEQVSKVWNSHSCFTGSSSGPIVVLDIELSLKANDEGRSQDRIDLVLFHLEEKQIRFVEVKTFNNKEIRPTPDGHIDVVEQIARYKKQLESNYKVLMEGYCQYVCLLNHLFEIKLPQPLAIDEEVDLLVTGFNSTQLQTLQTRLVPGFGKAFRTHLRGSLSGTKQSAIANWWGNRG